MAAAEVVHRLQMGEAWRADLAAIGPVGAVGYEIDPELALRRLDGGIGLAGRHMEALGIELEMVDQCLHGPLRLGAGRRRHLMVLGDMGSVGHAGGALPDDRDALAHLLHADEIAVVAVAVLADGDVEFHLVVSGIGLRLAQVPGGAGGAQHRSAEAPVECVLQRHDPDVDQALLEDPVLGQEIVDIVEPFGKALGPGIDVAEQTRRQILMHASRPVICGMQPRPADPFIELHEELALLEPPQEGRDRADIRRIGRDRHQMVEDPGDLVEQHADVLAARRYFEAEQLFDRDREGMLLAHGRDIVEPVEVRDRLQIGLVLDQLLGAAVEQPDMGIDALDDFAVHLHDHAQHPVGRRVLRPEVQGHRLDLCLGHQPFFSTFSSPGRCSMPSQGLRKSKLRKSWVSLTFS